MLCCNGEGPCDKCGATDSPRHHLDEEIYTEIANNPGQVRVLNAVDPYNQAMVPMGTTGTQSTNNSSIALSTSGQQLTSTLMMRKNQPVAGRSSGSHVSGQYQINPLTQISTHFCKPYESQKETNMPPLLYQRLCCVLGCSEYQKISKF